jgi:ATP:corrinoid adenosyltransferase
VTKNRRAKQAARERMAKTGENYTQAARGPSLDLVIIDEVTNFIPAPKEPS